MNLKISVLDSEDAPAKQINARNPPAHGSFSHPNAVRELTRQCGILTVEIEHVNTEVLREIAEVGVEITQKGQIARRGVEMQPNWRTGPPSPQLCTLYHRNLPVTTIYLSTSEQSSIVHSHRDQVKGIRLSSRSSGPQAFGPHNKAAVMLNILGGSRPDFHIPICRRALETQGVTTGSGSDLPSLKPGISLLRDLGISYHVATLLSPPPIVCRFTFAKDAAPGGIKAIFATAGGAHIS
ncbi:hypothetical protein GP486_002796 [Trichoglossum hirsutum]|uniref:PurT/PurK-like preATP-grasp domain-containing protein n=1 Tax=Trichoglossum hirsutum TaxID=265104 RepID=A0A9P8LED1_9PEZI|nr:hypothetical protein GP486_002796 [Trichoglossum hirsutum]